MGETPLCIEVRSAMRTPTGEVLRALVLQLNGSWMLRCNGDAIGLECPWTDVEPGDTWGEPEPVVAKAIEHVQAHAS